MGNFSAGGQASSWSFQDRLQDPRHQIDNPDAAAGLRPRLGNHPGPEGRSRCKQSIISGDIEPGRRHERCETFHQFQGLIDHVRGSVPPAPLEPIEKPAVRQKRQPLRGKRRTAGIAAETFQSQPVPSGDADAGMDAEAGDRRTAGTRWQVAIFGIHLVTHSRDAHPGALPRGHAPRDRGTVEFGKQRFVPPKASASSGSACGPKPRFSMSLATRR